MTALLDLLQNDGHPLRRVASTHGGEYAGPCPWCGGRDRFRAWATGRYWCRSCGKAGDAIQYLRDRRGLSFKEACQAIGREPGRPSGRASSPAPWTPREATTPPESWRQQARAFVDLAVKVLWSGRGRDVREWLHDERGLHDDTIREAGLGMNLSTIYAPRAAWGLPGVVREDGKPSPLWIPAGLVIPFFHGTDVHRLRIRRTDPGDGARYVAVSGSAMGPMLIETERRASAVVESELDGLLLHQEAGDLAGAVALGSVTTRPDQTTDEAIRRADSVLLALDADEAGARESWGWWRTHYPMARRWPVPVGKDPGEARVLGVSIREWVQVGMEEAEHGKERQG